MRRPWLAKACCVMGRGGSQKLAVVIGRAERFFLASFFLISLFLFHYTGSVIYDVQWQRYWLCIPSSRTLWKSRSLQGKGDKKNSPVYIYDIPSFPACSVYRVIQEESAILWEMIVCVILSKKVQMNMGPILNGCRDTVKRRYGPSYEHEHQLRNK